MSGYPHLRDVIPNRVQMLDMISQGYIRNQEHPTEPLFILNYTEKATYERVWNQATLNCRGLIVRSDTDEVVARPFPKFFNWNEPSAPKIDPAQPVWTTDKMDGSLGVRYWQPNAEKWAIATRGSFRSEQAVHATARLDQYYGGVHEFTDADDYKFTQLFEIIYPENRIVLQYGERDELVSLGVVHNFTGYVYPPSEISDPVFEQPLVFEAKCYEDALRLKPRPNAEGVVVVTRNAGPDGYQQMVKIKQAGYIALHKTITGLNDRVIWERLRAGDDAEAIKYGVPEEFWSYIDETATRLTGEFNSLVHDASITHNALVARLIDEYGQDWTRKQYAELVGILHFFRDLQFMLLDGRDITDVVWRKLKPEGASGPFQRNTEED